MSLFHFILGFCTLAGLFCVYMIVRVQCVFVSVNKKIDRYYMEGRLRTLDVEYEWARRMRQFWVWPLSRFDNPEE